MNEIILPGDTKHAYCDVVINSFNNTHKMPTIIVIIIIIIIIIIR